MPSVRRCLLLSLLLLAGGASGADQVGIRISLTITDACTVAVRHRQSPAPVQVECSSNQPYRVESHPLDARESVAMARGRPHGRVVTIAF